MSCIPSVKESIAYIFDNYLGIKLNLSNLCFDDNNNLFVQLTNINIEPNRINYNYLKNINIKLTKGIIGNIEIRIGVNTFEIKISKLSVMLMPVVSNNQNKEDDIKNEIEENDNEEKNENIKNNQTENKKGIIQSFIEYYLSKLKISIEEIELITFNYEIINKNLAYANPVLSFYIYNINYDIGETNENNFIRKNIWENKHFSIGGMCLRISKSFKNNNYSKEEEINTNSLKPNKKETISVQGENKKNINNIIDKNNNDNILLINSDKGIHFYTNTKNEILGDIGDIQLVINLFQLELLKNFIDTYSLYLNNNINKNIKKNKDDNKIKENIKKINSNSNINNNSVIINSSENEIMNIKINLNSFSIILLERTQNSDELKFYEFNIDKMTEHFCYFDDNFFIFILNNLCFQFDNKKKIISLKVDDISLNYIEYISKIKKEDEIEIERVGSEYSECNESLLKSSSMYQSMAENEINLNKNNYCSYDFKYNKNQIIQIKNINFGFNFEIKDKKKLYLDLNSININFHPFFLFKILKILYENSFLIKEILFFNYNQNNDENKEEDLLEEENNINNSNNKDIDIDTNIKKENKKKENNENLDLSFLTCEEDEDEDKEEEKEKQKENLYGSEISGENKIYISQDLFGETNNYEKKEKINDKIKNILKTLNIEIKIKTIEIRVYSFKCEENFCNIINPFFNEFYYEHIYIMDIKDDFKKNKLKINEITSSDYFNLIIKYLSLKSEKIENEENLILKFHSIVSSFTNNKILDILSDTYPVKYNLNENKIVVDLKFNLFFKVKLLPYMLSFVNIWKYTLLIFTIFQERMIYNYNKGKDELETMNFEEDVLKCFEQNKKIKKELMNNNELCNDVSTEDEDKLIIEINIKAININLDILQKKIKSVTTINNIKLNYIINNNKQSIEFSINKIESNDLKFYINGIKLDLNITKIQNKNSMNRIKSKTSKKIKKLKSHIIVPEEEMEIYIGNIIRLINRRNELDKNYNNKPKDEQIIDLNISINDIQLYPLEIILYANDIYNVIVKEEIINNNNISTNKKSSLYRTSNMRTSSISSKDSKINNINNSLNIQEKNNENKLSNNKEKDKDKQSLNNINFKIFSIKCIINDEDNHRMTELNIRDINLKNNNISCDIIEFFIFYEIKGKNNKVKINLGQINNTNVEIKNNSNNNTSFNIIIDEIFFSICNDSFLYIENILDNVGNIVSSCFVQGQKSNKIVIAKKTDKLINTYDIEDNQDERESNLFGNNVAKSVCLLSNKNEFKLNIDPNYLDNLKNEKEEKEEQNEIIDDIYKSNLKEKILKNHKENNLSLIIRKINIGLYCGLDFQSTVDIKTKSINYVNKNGEKNDNLNIINNNNNIIENNFNEQLKKIQKNIEKSGEYNKENNEENKEEENEENEIRNNLNLNIDEYKKNNDNNICKKDSDSFELIELNPNKEINARQKNNYLLFAFDNLNLSILYEKKNSYEIEFSINDFEVIDNLQDSNFKRLLSARKNILDDEKKNIPFLSIFVDISNSQNELSRNEYTDFNIACEISLASIQLMIHQNALLFILNFFIKKENIKKNDTKEKKELLKLYNMKQYHTKPSFILDSVFNQIIVEDFGEEQNDLIEDKNFLYITNFIFREFEVHITYESNDLGFSFQNIYIPLIPDLKDYPFVFNRITYKGFATIDEFTDFFVKHFVNQISKYNIIFNLLNSLSWTQPIFNIFGDFFDIFISPFQSYRKNQGFMHGLFKGIKKFFFNLLSKNVYAGEKMIRTLTTFIGVTKNNNIGKNSFYEKYILTDEKKKIYDYFYK